MSSLSRRAPFHEDETTISFASNLAAVNGAPTMRDFLRHMEMTRKPGIQDGTSSPLLPALDLGRLATLGGINRVTLSGHSVEIASTQHVKIGRETLLRNTVSISRFRFCPACVTGDISSGVGPAHTRSFVRFWWLVGTIEACPIHHIRLVYSKRNFDRRLNGDFASYLRSNLDEVLSFQKIQKHLSPSTSDNYQLARLRGERRYPFLDSLQFHVAVKLSEIIGNMQMAGLNKPSDDPEDLRNARERGFEVSIGGVSEFNKFLSGFLSNYWDSRKPSGGGRIYGTLYRWLAHYPNDDLASLRNLLRTHAIQNLPLGPGDDFFGEVTERRLHSVHSAAKQCQMHPKRLKKLLMAKGIVGSDQADFSDDRIVFDASSVDAFLAEISDNLSPTMAAKRLGVSPLILKHLTSAGHIKMFPGAGSDGHIRPRYSRVEVETFLRRVVRFAKPPGAPSAKMISILRAVSSAHCTWNEVIQLILDDGLENLTYYGLPHSLGALRVDIDEIRRKVALPEHGGISLREVEHRLGTTTPTVRALIQGGHLPVRVERNPVNRCKQRVVSPSDLSDFANRYVSLHGLASKNNEHIARMKERLERAGIEPAFKLGDKAARYYERDQVRAVISD